MRRIGTVVFWALAVLLLPFAAGAQEAVTEVITQASDGTWGYALGAGLAVGLAGLGCGIGQGLTA
ncbi:MAG: hypothetical protein MJA83_20360, partial [Gammaproteobacteria bacterium]|nr:hypothetical protein [Gammaproteobacteria bacterium]